MKIKVKTAISSENFGTIVLILLFLNFNSRILPYEISNSLTTIFFAVIGMAAYFIFKKRLDRHTIVCFAIALIAAVHSTNTEGIRYSLTLLCIIAYQEFYTRSYIAFIKCLIICGAIYSAVQIARGDIRAIGFEISGPQFACVMFICLSFMTVYFYNNKSDKKSLLYISGALILIFLSGTRSVLLFAFAIVAFYILAYLVDTGKISSKRSIFIIIAVLSICIFTLNYESIISIINNGVRRSASKLADSNRTRMTLYKLAINKIIGSKKIFIIGNGGGYIEELVTSFFGRNAYYPLHQDYLMIWCEYGIIGLVSVFYFYLRDHYSKWLFLFLFTACSFHNLVLSSQNIILIVLGIKFVERNQYAIWVGKSAAAVSIHERRLYNGEQSN